MTDSINPALFANCTIATCPLSTSYYNYRINLLANAILIGLFSVSLIWFVAVWTYTRRGFWFMLAMELGIMTETVGYVTRVVSWRNQWNQDAFLAQMSCIAIGPAFLSAGLYLCLGRIVMLYGESSSRLPARYYSRIFVPCDILSLILQAAGGILSSVELQNNKSLATGNNIMIAGLAFQVFTLLIFVALCADYVLCIRRRHRRQGIAAFRQDPNLICIRQSWQFRGFVYALALAITLILWRCSYRLAELNQGWNGPLTFDQYLFIGMESVLIIVAVYSLALFHPAFCLREALSGKNEKRYERSHEGFETGS